MKIQFTVTGMYGQFKPIPEGVKLAVIANFQASMKAHGFTEIGVDELPAGPTDADRSTEPRLRE
jgi:hypothetical protein